MPFVGTYLPKLNCLNTMQEWRCIWDQREKGAKMKPRIACQYLFLFFCVWCAVIPRVNATEGQTIGLSVKRGDTLSAICERYLESPGLWKKVASLNRLPNPHRIFPGQKIVIPVKYLKGLPMDGTVTFVRGEVGIFIRASEEWKTPVLNSKISQGSRIRTGEDGTIEITFGDGVSFLLRSNTSLEITTAQQKGALYRAYRLFLDFGRAVSRIRQITGEEERFEIDTPSAVAAARGTDFRAGVGLAGDARFEVLAGTVGVRGEKREVSVHAGEGTVVEKGRPPDNARPLLDSPAPVDLQQVHRKMPLVLAFSKVEGASSYRIMVSRDREAKDLVVERILTPGQAFSLIHLEDGGYYLHCRSIDQHGLEGIPSPPFPFNIRVNPIAPFIRSPVDGARFREKKIPFKWLKVKDAAAYQFQISKDPDFKALVHEARDFKDIAYVSPDLDYRSYYFRIRSVASDNYKGIWSDPIRFEIVPPPPSPPVEKPNLEDDKIQIRWKNLGAGVSYRIQMAKDPSFREVLVDQKVNTASVNLDRPKEPGVYYVRTSAMDSEGYEGGFSSPQSFEIERRFPFEILGALFFGHILILLLI
jgi:hypothetical protein